MKSLRLRGAALAVAVAFMLSLTAVAMAAPVPPDLQARLMALYKSWASLLGQGKLADAAAISVPDLKKQIIDAAKTKEDADGLASMARSMTPDTIEPKHASLSKDGKHAVIVTLATVKVPDNLKLPADAPPDAPKPGQILQSEITLKFERDGAEWKFAEQDFGMDPSQIKHCHDDAAETLAAYNQGTDQNAGGPIARVEFKPDHTLVVFRVLDEETCAILPAKEKLSKNGFDVASLTPYAIIQIDGYPHKTDKQRVWAEKYKIIEDE